MTFIISANYRDCSSPYRWLVRKASQDSKEAVACKSVKATKVQFQDSNAYEQGFGCRIVAWAESVEIQDAEKQVVRLRFTGSSFIEDTSKTSVPACSILDLRPDGSMFATI